MAKVEGKKAKARKAVRKAVRVDTQTTHKATRAADPLPIRLAGQATELADQPPLVALSAATIAAGLMLRRPAVLRNGVRMLASHLLATGAKTVLKGAVDRTRPSRAVRDGHRAGKGRGTGDTSLNSFPSGHTAGAVAVAEAVAAGAPAAALPARAAAAGVAVLQPSQGKHYISDVLVGAAIGWLAERAADAAMRAAERSWRKRDTADPLEESAAHPS